MRHCLQGVKEQNSLMIHTLYICILSRASSFKNKTISDTRIKNVKRPKYEMKSIKNQKFRKLQLHTIKEVYLCW